MSHIFKYIFLLIIIIGFNTCTNNPLDVDVSDIDLSIDIDRFDVDLSNADIENIDSSIIVLYEKYDKFFDLYNHKIINIGSSNSSNYAQYFHDFISDFTVNEIMVAVQKEFVGDDDIRLGLQNAFRHVKYYYPKYKMPQIITFVAGFNQSIVIDENILAVGLDKYIGVNSDIYKHLGVPMYKKQNMHRSKIPSDCMRAIAITEYEFSDSVNNLLCHMIYEGKIMYFVDAMLPSQPDSLKIGYTKKQLEWCKRNEKSMWTFFIEKKVLFSTEYMQIKRYIDDSPFTATFSQLSPGRTGVWLGWQIVQSYMKNNPELSLQDLMLDNDYQRILNKSKYKP